MISISHLFLTTYHLALKDKACLVSTTSQLNLNHLRSQLFPLRFGDIRFKIRTVQKDSAMISITSHPEETLQSMITNEGTSVWDMSMDGPVLLIFLRHFGCIFCREALSDISKRKSILEQKGTKIVFVHMSEASLAERYFGRYDLEGAIHISDPECKLYKVFGLSKGTFTQLFGLSVWIRGFQAGVVNGHGVGNQLGDGFQMPGVFAIQDGTIKDQYIHKVASDRPDYERLMDCCTI